MGTFLGEAPVSGEVVFHTAHTGYQEILSDPSYAGQIVTFTYPHIGNYGVSAAGNESARPQVRGAIMRSLERASSWRADGELADWCADNGLGVLTHVDTRRLTRLLRDRGAVVGAFGPRDAPLAELAAAERGTDGIDLVKTVTTAAPYLRGDPEKPVVVAYDFGIKESILARLGTGAHVRVVPAATPAEEVLADKPAGVFLSNGPGDPREVPYALATVEALLDNVPLFGICLGHQLLTLAAGGSVEKLPFGHHGANHPVQDLTSGVVEITSQNHNFATAERAGQSFEVTHRSLNDGVVEGISIKGARAFSVQHHPEAGPGPHDAHHHFERFFKLIGKT